MESIRVSAGLAEGMLEYPPPEVSELTDLARFEWSRLPTKLFGGYLLASYSHFADFPQRAGNLGYSPNTDFI